MFNTERAFIEHYRVFVLLLLKGTEDLFQSLFTVCFSGRKNIVYPQRLGPAMCSLPNLGTHSGEYCAV